MIDYKSAGVNIDSGNEVVTRIKKSVKRTFDANVLTELGGFAALYDLKTLCREYEEPVLVQSIDGLGTKPVIATMMQRYDTLGHDLLSATCNDILVCGAKPLTLLDYIGTSRLKPDEVVTIVEGMTHACIENGVSLVGGETAEMPGVYTGHEYDIVGIITGILDKNKCINGKSIQPGDTILGFSSSGLHTNGYSLARKLCFELANYKVTDYIAELNTSIGEALLAAHINYTQPVLALTRNFTIKGMAHITGGGLLENIPRILPPSCTAAIELGAWPDIPIFNWLTNLGQLSQQEAYRTLNMGIGYILVVTPSLANDIISFVAQHFKKFKLQEIGKIVSGNGQVVLK